MILDWLFIALILAVAWQPNLERMGTVAIFAGVTVGFDFLFGALDGPNYYMAGAFFGLVIMYALSFRNGGLSGILQAFCVVDIFANAAGLFCYIGYERHIGYDRFYEIFYSAVVITLYAGGPYGWTRVANSFVRGIFRRSNNGSGDHCKALATEESR